MSASTLKSRAGWGTAMALVAALSCGSAFAGKPTTGGGGGGGPTSGSCDGAAANQFAGRAYSVLLDSTIAGLSVDLGPVPDTGELPATGGVLDATLVSLDGLHPPAPLDLLPVGVDLQAAILKNTAMGSGNEATAMSSVLGLNLGVRNGLAPLVNVSADLVTASATRKCAGGVSSTVAGQTGSDLAKLAISIMGKTVVIPASAPANTKLALPAELGILVSGGITLNEQLVSNGRQVVNAVHVTLNVLNILGASVASVNLIVSHAEAGETCGTGSNPNACNCSVKDFMTGIGYVDLASGDRINFGIHGGLMGNGLKGHLNLIDHDTNQHFTSDLLTKYSGADSGTTTRTLTFACTDGSTYTGDCVVEESDNGEPGGGVDGFRMTPFYDAQGQKITHGNVQLHKPDCGATTSTGGKPPKK